MTHITTSITSLLDNKKGLTILSALFLLFACEEPSELPLGISPKQGNISTHYLEIPIEVNHFKLETDSVVSSMTTSTAPTLIGKLDNARFGTLTATAFSNLGTPDSVSIPTAAELADENVDSIKLSLTYNSLFLGDNINAPQTLQVYRLKAPIEQKPKTESGPLQYMYFTTDSESLQGAELLGEATFDTTAVSNSSTPKTVWIHLEDAFAEEIWQELKDNPATFQSQEAMDAFIGSLAFVPGENNTFINGYTFNSSGSAIDIYYGSTLTATSGYISFPFRPLLRRADEREYSQLPTYYNLSADYSNTALEGVEDLQAGTSFQPSDNQLYFRAGVGFLPKLSFSELEEFVTSNNLSKAIINSAVIEIDSVQRRIGTNLSAPVQLNFNFVSDENNSRFTGVNGERYAGALMQAQQYVAAQNDTLLRYRADVTDEIEMFFQYENSKYLQGMLFQSSNTAAGLPNTLPNFVADPQRVVLKVYYTTLEETGQDN